MIVELHENLKNPMAIPATRVLITDSLGNPICFAVEFTPGHTRVFHVGDSDFNEQMAMHGFDRTVLVSRLNINDFKPKIALGS